MQILYADNLVLSKFLSPIHSMTPFGQNTKNWALKKLKLYYKEFVIRRRHV